MSSTLAVDERIAERRREVRRERMLRRRRRTIVGLVLLAALLAAAAVERSSLVALSEVTVRGVDRLSEQEVRAAADLPLGTSILRVRLGAAEQRVRELPLVADVDARRAGPLTVELVVTERIPVLVARSGAGARLIDADGVVLARGSEDHLPAVEVTGTLPRVGDRAEPSQPVGAALAVLRGLPGALRAQILSYAAPSVDDVRLTLRSGVVVKVGDASRLDEKARALGAVLDDLGVTEVAMIDVRAPGAPTVSRTVEDG